MKKFVLALWALAASISASAQLNVIDEVYAQKYDNKNLDTVAWLKNVNFTLGANQGLLHNWTAGGELASLAVNSNLNANLVRYHHRHVWTNTLDANYGLFYAYSNDFIARKTDDRLDITSKYGYRISPTSNFYLTALLNVKTQFTKGYNYDLPNWRDSSTSNFLSPLYVMFSPGIEYRKGTVLSVFFSPIAFRLTHVDPYYTLQRPEGAFGVEHGKRFRTELGAYFSARVVKDFNPNLSYRGRLDLYSNYLAKNIYENGVLVKKDHPGNIDIMIDNFLSYKFFKFFSANFGLTAIYDNDVPFIPVMDANGQPKKEPISGLGWWQIKQYFTLGFAYKL